MGNNRRPIGWTINAAGTRVPVDEIDQTFPVSAACRTRIASLPRNERDEVLCRVEVRSLLNVEGG